MERFMVCCGAKFFRPGSILLSPFFCRWVLDWQENEGGRMGGWFQVSGRDLGAVAEGYAPLEGPALGLVTRRGAFRLRWPRWIQL